jgi:hypothetical protein
MNTIRKRLDDLEKRDAFRKYIESKRQCEGRSQDDLRFFTTHGYFPEAAGDKLPNTQEFTVRGIRTVIFTDRAGKT